MLKDEALAGNSKQPPCVYGHAHCTAQKWRKSLRSSPRITLPTKAAIICRTNEWKRIGVRPLGFHLDRRFHSQFDWSFPALQSHVSHTLASCSKCSISFIWHRWVSLSITYYSLVFYGFLHVFIPFDSSWSSVLQLCFWLKECKMNSVVVNLT